MEPSSASAKRDKASLYRQVNFTFIILSLSFCSNATAVPEYRTLSEYILYFLGAVPGLLLLLVLTECKGRRLLLISLFLLFILSSFLRFFLPMVQAATVILTPIVMCEYSDPKLRMVLLISNSAVLRISSWLVVFDSVNGNTWELDFFRIGLALACIFSIITCPESPYWLASKRRFEESKQEFLSLRGDDSQSRNEILEMIKETPRRGSLQMFYTPLLLVFPVLFTSSYPLYLEKRIGMDQDKFLYTVILNVICALITALISLKLPRRIYFLSSTALLFTLLILAWIWHLCFDDNEEVKIGFIIVIYVAVVCGPIGIYNPFLIEIIPQKYVTIVTAFASCVNCFVYVFLDLFSGLFDEGPILCVSVFVSFLSAYFFLPEAKNKTLLEIEQLYLKTDNSERQKQTKL